MDSENFKSKTALIAERKGYKRPARRHRNPDAGAGGGHPHNEHGATNTDENGDDESAPTQAAAVVAPQINIWTWQRVWNEWVGSANAWGGASDSAQW